MPGTAAEATDFGKDKKSEVGDGEEHLVRPTDSRPDNTIGSSEIVEEFRGPVQSVSGVLRNARHPRDLRMLIVRNDTDIQRSTSALVSFSESH